MSAPDCTRAWPDGTADNAWGTAPETDIEVAWANASVEQRRYASALAQR